MLFIGWLDVDIDGIFLIFVLGISYLEIIFYEMEYSNGIFKMKYNLKIYKIVCYNCSDFVINIIYIDDFIFYGVVVEVVDVVFNLR